MKRGAFTLIEVMISVMLIALIAMFMYGALGGTRASNATLQKHADDERVRLQFFKLLYRDLVESYSVNPLATGNKHYQILELQTQNSLYGIAAPHVLYFVHADNLTLVRLESAQPITLPVTYELHDRIHVEVLDTNVTDFNFYTAGKGNVPQELMERSTEQINAAFEKLTGGNTEAKPAPHAVKKHLLYLNTKTRPTPLLMEVAF